MKNRLVVILSFLFIVLSSSAAYFGIRSNKLFEENLAALADQIPGGYYKCTSADNIVHVINKTIHVCDGCELVFGEVINATEITNCFDEGDLDL